MPTLKRITHLPETLQVLEAEASEAGFKFLHRLIQEWESGINKFEQPGECLFAAFDGEPALASAALT